MEYVLEQLNRSMVLTREDILVTRQMIEEKFAASPYAQKAIYLAEALHKIVDRSLVGIDPTKWSDLKRSLFQNTLARNKSEINRHDVFEEIIALKMEVNRICITAFEWMIQGQIEGVKPGELGPYVKRRATYIQKKRAEESDETLTSQSGSHSAVAAIEPLSVPKADEVMTFESYSGSNVTTTEERDFLELKSKKLLLEPPTRAALLMDYYRHWRSRYRITWLGVLCVVGVIGAIATAVVLGIQM